MILVDAHVHIYDCFDLKKFFDSAYANFKSAAEQLGYDNDFTGILFLVETSKENWFQRLTDHADGKDLPGGKNTGAWLFQRTDENNVLLAESGYSKKLRLIAGRQINTSEGLEVLALSIAECFKDGIPIKRLIKDIIDKGGIPVIPWGFGKWMGRRGTILNRMLQTAKDSGFCLGDNGNRPAFMPAPSQFILAQRKKIPNLPGSDPLPFASEVDRVGCFGMMMPNEPSEKQSIEHLKEILNKPGKNLMNYGAFERPYRFFRNQIASQLRKRIKGL